MELINATRMVAGYTMGLTPSGRESLVVVIKGTFRFPRNDEPTAHFALHDEQLPLVLADTFTGAPGLSSPVREMDFPPFKARCDVLLLGCAHAPHGCTSKRVDVELRVGDWCKKMVVTGSRHWDFGVSGPRASSPEPFSKQVISYDVAFGGVDLHHDDPAEHAAFMANPVGRGFHMDVRREWLDGSPLASTQEIGHEIADPRSVYRPMSFGPIGRSWEPRSRLAGTYDQEWLDEYFPFLPPDFDTGYYQAAPADQQLPLDAFRSGPTTVTLVGLTPYGFTRFTIPNLQAPVSVFPKKGGREDLFAVFDTLLIEPEEECFTMTWRAARPLRKSLHEIAQVLVGRKGRDWWQRRDRVDFPIPVIMVPMLRKEVEQA